MASPVFPQMKFVYNGLEYGYKDENMLKVPSIHLKGTKDKFSDLLTIDSLFFPEFNPLVIPFDDGHRFPRSLSD